VDSGPSKSFRTRHSTIAYSKTKLRSFPAIVGIISL
jgi:hypothetical protein